MTRTSSLLCAVLLAGAVGACDADRPAGGDGGVPDGGGTDAGGNNNFPAKPTLGPQQDRTGRPAINTALTAPFVADMAQKGMIKDAYNKAGVSSWGDFQDEIAGNLAIIDSLDTVCGNQLLAGPDPVAGRYDTLASVLVDDRLYLNTAATSCTQYLAVEANAIGITNNDCGGRTPSYDVADVSYSVLAAGVLEGVTDGVAADDKPASNEFPFFSAP